MPVAIRAACLSLLLVLGACSRQAPPPAAEAAVASQGAISAQAPWVRAAPPGASVTAGYLKLRNDGDQAVQVIAVHSEAAGETMMHSMATENGLMQMRMLERLEIPAHGSVALAPGGTHLMLMGLKQALSAGDEVTVSFRLDNGQELSVPFPVRETAP
ncbi:hypothetical protein SAMN04488038_10595 [Solimonas aquatica]|uniref:Copper(I)-binding protein n=1 Tax=Solimonas aquatica TaxID=489703 RepID=A0A1H9EMS6_9GAMM|nr:copper chaperone PCu(A)C [Solimonas aquatica]SEQ27020.1 hypothetical protein SAMN04488038_10595 [Solimonas aquatica]